MSVLPLLLALLAAFVTGFALQRGTICAVAAVDDLLARRDPRRLAALMLGSLWILGTVVLLEALLDRSITGLSASPITPLTLAAAALYGAGAAVNGGCAVGSIAKLAQGRLYFLALAPGFVVGALAVELAVDAGADLLPALRDAAPVAPWVRWGAVAVLGIAVAALVGTRGRALHPRRAWGVFAAMAVVAVASAVAAVVAGGPWSYTTSLTAVATPDMDERRLIAWGFVLFAALLAGALASARLGPDPIRLRFGGRAALKSLFGGAAMGAASRMIPGGNDLLLFFGLPFLLAHAWAAYGAMLVSIALLRLARARRRPADRPSGGS